MLSLLTPRPHKDIKAQEMYAKKIHLPLSEQSGPHLGCQMWEMVMVSLMGKIAAYPCFLQSSHQL